MLMMSLTMEMMMVMMMMMMLMMLMMLMLMLMTLESQASRFGSHEGAKFGVTSATLPREHSDPELGVRVWPGTLQSSACS